MSNNTQEMNETPPKTHPLSFSPLVIGTMRLGAWGVNMSTKEYETFIHQCLELGLTDFDHADIYGGYTTEAEFGEVIKGRSSLRAHMQLTTKCGIRFMAPTRPVHRIKSYDSTPKHIIQSVENSLQALQTDYIDVLLLHRPDFLMNPYEIAETFTQLQTSGKVRAFGVSNFTHKQFEFLQHLFPLVTHQIEVSLLQLAPFYNDMLLQCLQHHITPTAWSPLAGGAFFAQQPNKRIQRILQVTDELCETYSCGLDQLLLAWVMKHPSGVIPVLGTANIERVKAAKTACDIHISHEDWYALWEASTGEPVP